MGLPGPNSLLRRHCLLEFRDIVAGMTGRRVIAESIIIRTFWSLLRWRRCAGAWQEGLFDFCERKQRAWDCSAKALSKVEKRSW